MQYIGDKEIALIEGNKVTFADETSVELTDSQLEYMVSDEMRDASQMRAELMRKIVPKFLGIMEDYDIKRSDIWPLMSVVVDSYNRALKIAIGKAFGTYDENLHQDFYEDNIKMSDIKRLNQ